MSDTNASPIERLKAALSDASLSDEARKKILRVIRLAEMRTIARNVERLVAEREARTARTDDAVSDGGTRAGQ